MGKFIDLTGRVFGRLTVIKRAPDRVSSRGNRSVMWECQCVCGKRTVVASVNLRQGKTKSCGCLITEPKDREDLVGSCFGRLTVVARGEDLHDNKGNAISQWQCRCSCGNPDLVLVRAGNLKAGNTSSCGCLLREHRESFGSQMRKENHYEELGDVIVGYTNNGLRFYFDKEDFEKIKPYCWCDDSNGYLIARNPQGKMIKMHRLIMNAIGGKVIDHINHNTAYNRKVNLRVISQTENMKNMRLKANNKSGVAGVCKETRTGKWIVTIYFDKHSKSLGRFDSFDDAVAARKAAEEKYFGPYSYDNSIASVPRIAV